MAVDEFDAFERKMQDEGLPELAIEAFRRAYQKVRAGASGMLGRAEIGPVDSVQRADETAIHAERGARELSRAVVIKLNGGLGTSMGMTRAKSLLTVRDDLCFLDLIARQVLALRERHGVALPLVLMDSFRTRDDSLARLARYPDLAVPGLPLDFLQHKVPKVLAADFAPVHWPQQPEHEWAPPGHGDLYPALATSGLLDRLLAAGHDLAFVSNADNLGAVLDLGILGWMAAEDVPFAMEVAERTAADRKGGHLAKTRDGRLTLREVAQCPPEEEQEFQDIDLYRFFNTNSLWMDLRRLRAALDDREHPLDLPLICNRKTVDPRDPDSPACLQLESAMGAAIARFEGARAIQVPRSRFAPVKTTNDLLVVRSDAYALEADARLVAAATAPLVDLDPRHFKRIDDFEARFPGGAPSLARCRRLTVRGDVVFGRDVELAGDVTLEHDGDEPLRIADGTRLGG
ncbi:MAG: UTP--glucose-1-phosphate uridylyltransferase [Myxococcota bacterium]|nr:UTP--glucose-1-phosphate uridylyltransferase [Myxococcota bacterium]